MTDFMTMKDSESGTRFFYVEQRKQASIESFQGKHWKLKIIRADFYPNPCYWVPGYLTLV